GGDGGWTSLGNNERVSKNDHRIACLGVIDELNSFIGLAIGAYKQEKKTGLGLLGAMHNVQHDLFDIGADLSIPFVDGDNNLRLTEQQIIRLEILIEEDNKTIPPVDSFILPGGCLPAAYLHVARTVCRRAERTITGLRSHNRL